MPLDLHYRNFTARSSIIRFVSSLLKTPWCCMSSGHPSKGLCRYSLPHISRHIRLTWMSRLKELQSCLHTIVKLKSNVLTCALQQINFLSLTWCAQGDAGNFDFDSGSPTGQTIESANNVSNSYIPVGISMETYTRNWCVICTYTLCFDYTAGTRHVDPFHLSWVMISLGAAAFGLRWNKRWPDTWFQSIFTEPHTNFCKCDHLSSHARVISSWLWSKVNLGQVWTKFQSMMM